MKSRCFFFNFKYYVEFIVRTFSISTPVYIETKFLFKKIHVNGLNFLVKKN